MKHDKLFLKATVCSLLTLIFYLIAYAIIGAVTREISDSFSVFTALLILSLFVMMLYSYLFIHINYIRNGYIEDSLFNKDEYSGIKDDIIKFLNGEKSIFITAACINMGSWLLISLEKLIFGKRVLTAILLIYAPMNIISVALPEWLNGILGYITGSICIYLFYIIELAIIRNITYKKMYLKK